MKVKVIKQNMCSYSTIKEGEIYEACNGDDELAWWEGVDDWLDIETLSGRESLEPNTYEIVNYD